MEKVVYLLSDSSKLDSLNCGALLIPVGNISTRSYFARTLDEIRTIKENTNKEIYLLCDKIILESERKFIEDIFADLLSIGDKIFFSDFVYYMQALRHNALDKLVLYSPTLAVSVEDINAWKKCGLKHIIISKECEYDGYLSILNEVKDINLGMLACGYPQIYYSRRQMLTAFKNEYPDTIFENDTNLTIKEKTRTMKMPIFEDDNGTFIFAGELFYPNIILKEFKDLGMKYFIIDPSFTLEQEKLIDIVRDGLNGIDSSSLIEEEISSFMLYRKMVNNYDK